MLNIYSSIRFVLATLLCLAVANQSFATQLQYVTSVVSQQHVANAGQAIDNSPTTAATLTAPALFGSASLRLGFGSVVPVGGTSGLVIQAGSNVDASALSSMTIRTYMGSNTTYEESISVSSLVNLTAVSGSKTTVEFSPSKAFNQIELRIAGLASASFDVDLYSAYGTLTSPLPVELVTFQGKNTAAGAALAWSTASERNSDYFAIERADESPENFQVIGRVQAAGTTAHRTQYNFVDARPATLSYYRLRQVDRDGTTSFSPVVTVKSAALGQSLVVYPSPATEAVTVTGVAGTRFALFDQLGRHLQTGEVLAGARPTLDVRALPGGVYFVRDLATGSSTRFLKIVAAE